MVAAFLHILPLILGALLCLFVFYGFWQGLTLRPHEREHRQERDPTWWWRL